MMPFYSGSTRSKRPKKDGTGRAASIISSNSHSTSKSSKLSGEKPKVDSKVQSTVPKSSGSSTTHPVRPQATQAKNESERKAPNVFEYLEDNSTTEDDDEEEDEDDSSADEYGHHQVSNSHPKMVYTGSARQTYPAAAQGMDTRSRTSSVMSKSSANSQKTPSSIDIPPSATPSHVTRNNIPTHKPSMEGAYSAVGSFPESSNYVEKRSMDLGSRPEVYYPRNSVSLQRSPLPPSPPRSPEDDLHRPTRRRRRSTKSSSTSSGYGLLASRLSSAAESQEPRIPPLYRRFEDINHRVLLHLQDEIAQMEEDLRVLDEYEELHRLAAAEQEGTTILPASRRMDAQAQVYSSLHYRREELLGALARKTEQYNNALSAYSKVLQTLPSASTKDIDTYRDWMKEKNPVVAAETRFLDYSKDLISLTPHITASTTSTTKPVFSAIIIASAAVLLPLLAFNMISEFSGRILVVAVVGGAASAIASTHSTGADQIVDSRDGWRCATIYFMFMTAAAMFIP
ncbi:hypothetical protein BO94DRAFT_101928 [Aspergillus sclerotioniger CBS 115572]|uniref:DUF6594 domain-containing protein n=1 Tax=Aspergillus sclerotioniger CBS 115572 TaxID=1450535 RepID=A0A317WE24_9EURO|nr:hypothetical protein BO94DRAFT_101928 [Aspergillus sclerotioniger CBS 115572]PWY84529.1 hypothetical protein BO94DRAFT_101928 [Aspergillus sclerotioniger CBS 115572]